jgi:hypothetical protein
MFARKLKVIIAALAAVTAAALLYTPVGIAGNATGAYKLGGVWIAKVQGSPGQWTYVVAPDPSGRRAVAHGHVEVGPNVELVFGPYDRISPLLVDIEVTGPESASYNSIWYGMKDLELEPPVPVGTPNSELVLIGVAKGTIAYMGPGKATAVHSFEWYFPAQDGDGDGLPDAGEDPVLTFQLTTVDTRLPSP